MDLDMVVDGLFGEREGEVVSGSDGDDNDDDDDGDSRNNPDEEAVEVPAPGARGEAGGKTQEVIKPKRVIKNPRPKLDVQRLMGPRGVPALQRTFKDVRWGGKGREREDLRELLRRLQHWAHRLYPAMPFSDTLAQIEKLGAKKNVKVHIKKLRLDMFEMENNGNGDGEDNVRRWGDDAEWQHEDTNSGTPPVVDVFDELLGTPAGPTIILPPVSSQPVELLTAEQKERLARNRRLAAERRMMRQREEEEEDKAKEEALRQQADWSPEQLFGTLKPTMGNVREYDDDAKRNKRRFDNTDEMVEAPVTTTLPTIHHNPPPLPHHTGVTDADMPARDTSPPYTTTNTNSRNLNSQQDAEMREEMDNTPLPLQDAPGVTVTDMPARDISPPSRTTNTNSSDNLGSQQHTEMREMMVREMDMDFTDCVLPSTTHNISISSHPTRVTSSGVLSVEGKSVACTHQAKTSSRKPQQESSENDQQNSNDVMCKKKLTNYLFSQLESVNEDRTIVDACSMEGEIDSSTDHSVNGMNQCQSKGSDGVMDAGGREERASRVQDGDEVRVAGGREERTCQKQNGDDSRGAEGRKDRGNQEEQDGDEAMGRLNTEDLMKMLED